MTPNNDIVQKLLGALKDSHQKHMDAIGVDLRDSSFGCEVCKFIAQTEAQLAGEGKTGSEWVKVRLYAVETPRGWVKIKTVSGERVEDWTHDGFIATLFNDTEANEQVKKHGGKKVYRETREYAKDHPLAAVPQPSPANACIRAGKAVLRVLNMPEGAGVAFAFDRWYATDGKPSLRKTMQGADAWWFEYTTYPLPLTAIPPWPGDFRTSWITALTEEVRE